MKFSKSTLAILAVASISFACLPMHAAIIVGLSFPSSGGGDNDIFTINSSSPGLIQQSHPVTGLQANEQLRGIDFWNGTIFGLGSGGNLGRIRDRHAERYLALAEFWIESRGNNVGRPDWERESEARCEAYVRGQAYGEGRPSWGAYAQDHEPVLEMRCDDLAEDKLLRPGFRAHNNRRDFC